MAVPYYIIDGYNVLHAAGVLQLTLNRGDLQRAREWLLGELVTAFRPRERQRICVVFDAAEGPAHLPRQVSYESIEIHFSPRDSDADTLIEALLRRHSAPRQVRVVSSDRRLLTAARRRRAQGIGSLEFLDLLTRRQSHRTTSRPDLPPSHPKHSGDVSEFEAARWLDYFGYSAEESTSNTSTASEPPDASSPESSSKSASPVANVGSPIEPREPSPRELHPRIDLGSQIDDVAYWQARIAELDVELARERAQQRETRRRRKP